MGGPKPSRYVVIERVKKEISKEQVKTYMSDNKTELRSIKLMSREESLYKRYLLEISVDDMDRVLSESFWPQGVRVRIFRGRGNDWRDREIPEEETGNAAENNNSSIQSN